MTKIKASSSGSYAVSSAKAARAQALAIVYSSPSTGKADQAAQIAKAAQVTSNY